MVAIRKEDASSGSGRGIVNNWLVALAAVVDVYGGESITEVDALLVKVADDFIGGMVLKKILAWMSAVKRDYIWKSDGDWDAELGLSYKQMRRVREKVLAPIVSTYQKSARNRTMHYRLNTIELMKRIARVLKVGFMQVSSILLNQQDASSAKGSMQPADSGTTLTKKPTNSSIKKTKNVVVEELDPLFEKNPGLKALLEKGYGQTEVLKYQALGAELIQACIDDTDEKERLGKIEKTYRAYLTGALNIQLKDKQARDMTAMMFELPETGMPEQGEIVMPENVKPIGAADDCEPELPNWWKAVRGQMEYQMPLSVWSYLSHFELISDDASEVVLLIPESCPEDIAYRYSRNIQRLVAMARGASEVRFERKEQS